MQKIAIIGTTSWGITLGILLVNKGIDIRLWARTEREANKIMKKGLDQTRFPDIAIPPQMVITSQMDEAMDDVNAVIMAVPSATMRQNISHVESHLDKKTLIVSAAKGLEIGSNKRMSQVIVEEIDPHLQSNICVISGPNLAREIMRDLPAAAVVAAEEAGTARKAQRLLRCRYRRRTGLWRQCQGRLYDTGTDRNNSPRYGAGCQSAYFLRTGRPGRCHRHLCEPFES